MHSAHTRGVTIVTILTLIFTPMLKHHHWFNFLTGTTVETKVVKCEKSKPCPFADFVVKKIVLPKQP